MALVVVLIFAMVPMALCVLIGRVFPRLMQFLFGCAIGAAIIFLASQQRAPPGNPSHGGTVPWPLPPSNLAGVGQHPRRLF